MNISIIETFNISTPMIRISCGIIFDIIRIQHDAVFPVADSPTCQNRMRIPIIVYCRQIWRWSDAYTNGVCVFDSVQYAGDFSLILSIQGHKYNISSEAAQSLKNINATLTINNITNRASFREENEFIIPTRKIVFYYCDNRALIWH